QGSGVPTLKFSSLMVLYVGVEGGDAILKGAVVADRELAQEPVYVAVKVIPDCTLRKKLISSKVALPLITGLMSVPVIPQPLVLRVIFPSLHDVFNPELHARATSKLGIMLCSTGANEVAENAK